MKSKIIVSLLASVVLGASAPLVLAQEETPTIAGVPVTTAIAVGIVGATIIGAAVDDDDNDGEDPTTPPDTTPPPTTTTTTGT